MRTVAAALCAFALLGVTAPARAHDDFEGEGNGRFEASLVSDADGGDFGVGSADGSFVTLDGEDSGKVRMQLTGVTDAGGMPASAATCHLVVTGLANGAPFTKTFDFALVGGAASVHDALGLPVADLLEVQSVSAACDPVGVFAVTGVRADSPAGDDDGDDDGNPGDGHHGDGNHGDGGEHGDLVTRADGHGHGGDHHGAGQGKVQTSLVGDFDGGDFAVDSAMGSFLSIDGQMGGAVQMMLAGVSDAGGPVNHAGNQLVITGARNGVPFTATFPFALVGGVGKVRGSLSLVQGDVLEIQSMSVTDGTTVFAVPGLFIHTDEDSDGVPDGGDACTGTAPQALVGADGCSLQQRCACGADRGLLRSCLRAAAAGVKAQVKASCGKGKRCRKAVRRIAAQRRQALHACGRHG